MKRRKANTRPANGPVIARLRFDRQMKIEELAERAGSTSSTITRAEKGSKIVFQTLVSIARVLDVGVESIIRPETQADVAQMDMRTARKDMDLTGRWRGFYVVDERDAETYIVEEDFLVEQMGSNVKIDATTHGKNEDWHEQLLYSRISRDSLIGAVRSLTFPEPFGSGTFQVVSNRGDEWLEGFTTWYDIDERNIRISKYIAVRLSSRFVERYLKEAKKDMEREIILFKQRFC